MAKKCSGFIVIRIKYCDTDYEISLYQHLLSFWYTVVTVGKTKYNMQAV